MAGMRDNVLVFPTGILVIFDIFKMKSISGSVLLICLPNRESRGRRPCDTSLSKSGFDKVPPSRDFRRPFNAVSRKKCGIWILLFRSGRDSHGWIGPTESSCDDASKAGIEAGGILIGLTILLVVLGSISHKSANRRNNASCLYCPNLVNISSVCSEAKRGDWAESPKASWSCCCWGIG